MRKETSTSEQTAPQSPPPFLPFSRPSIGEEEIAEVVDSLRSGWITTGPKVQAFEKAFAEYVGVKHAVAVSSCTAGLHLSLLALLIGPGDEVITSPMTFAATVNMIVRVGAKPVFADIDRQTRQIDPAAVEACITAATRLIVPVHFAGNACDLDRLEAIAARRGIPLLEDAAHAAGTEYKGARIGSRGHPAVFSFHPIKNMTTGEGGMVTTDDDELAERVRLLRFHGIGKDAWKRYTAEGASQYDVLLPGFKYNMMDLQAALGIHQLRRLEGFIEERAAQAARYGEALAGIPGLELPDLPPYPVRHAWHLYTVLVGPPALDRDGFMEALKARGIGTGLHFKAVHLHRYYAKELGYGRGLCPEAEYVSDRIVSLPLYPGLAPDDQARVAEAVRGILHGGEG